MKPSFIESNKLKEGIERLVGDIQKNQKRILDPVSREYPLILVVKSYQKQLETNENQGQSVVNTGSM